MFKINLEENAGAAYLESLDALKKILDGEGNYKNYRAYVLNLHSALELFFKKKLFDHNEFMLFNFSNSNYKKLMAEYEQAFKAGKTLFDYIESRNKNLPNTVTFKDAIQRLAYLYKESEFTINYIMMLEKLNTIRNDITHFELSLQDDQFVLLNGLFIACTNYYSEYVEWGYNVPFDLNEIQDKNLSIQKAIVKEPFNRRLLDLLDNSNDSLVDDFLDFSYLATCLIENRDYEEKEKEKLVKRLRIFENAGLFGYGSASGEHWDVGWFFLSDICKSLLNETA